MLCLPSWQVPQICVCLRSRGWHSRIWQRHCSGGMASCAYWALGRPMLPLFWSSFGQSVHHFIFIQQVSCHTWPCVPSKQRQLSFHLGQCACARPLPANGNTYVEVSAGAVPVVGTAGQSHNNTHAEQKPDGSSDAEAPIST
jgi:hypothetical protein